MALVFPSPFDLASDSERTVFDTAGSGRLFMPYSATMRHSNMYSIYAQYEPVDGISEESRAAPVQWSLCQGTWRPHDHRFLVRLTLVLRAGKRLLLGTLAIRAGKRLLLGTLAIRAGRLLLLGTLALRAGSSP